MGGPNEAEVQEFKKRLEESGFMEKVRSVITEIETKKLVPIDLFIEFLKERYEYCERCEADEPAFIDTSGEKPVVRCVWCGKTTRLDSIAKRARAMPCDYLERMVTAPPRRTVIEKIGEDTWVADGILAEVAGDERMSYPDRGKFKPTDSISKMLSALDMDSYEKAVLSRSLYRVRYSRNHIAVLKSKNHTAYISDEFTEFFGGIFEPFITSSERGPQPILVKEHGKLRRIIMPMRFDPAELDGE